MGESVEKRSRSEDKLEKGQRNRKGESACSSNSGQKSEQCVYGSGSRVSGLEQWVL